MAESITSYPRWRGGSPLREGPKAPLIAWQEVLRVSKDLLFIVALAVAVFLPASVIFNLIDDQGERGDAVHTFERFYDAVFLSHWAAVALAAVMAGPVLVDDRRGGALEIYMTRAVGGLDYLLGKILSVFFLSFAAVAVPLMAYFFLALGLFNEHPDGWFLVPIGILADAVIWGLLASGIGLAIASFSRSSRGATLTYFGSFALLALALPTMLEAITDAMEVNLLSPVLAMQSQTVWLFGEPSEHGFPGWWGLVEVLVLIVVSWGVFLSRRPRVRGDESGNSG